MSIPITRFEIGYEQDVVSVRQRARIIAEMLGFQRQDQTRISTAVSEISRNALQYGKGGTVEFLIEKFEPSTFLTVVITDHGPGIANLDEVLNGLKTSNTAMGLGLIGSRRLVDRFHIETRPSGQGVSQGTTVTIGKTIPSEALPITPEKLRLILEALASPRVKSPFDEIVAQNQELLRTLEDLRASEEVVKLINQELIKTNDGVLILNTELELKNERIKASEKKLLEYNSFLKIFATTVAHDLKAPLRGIIGYAQELQIKHSMNLGARAAFCLSSVLTAAQNLQRQIDDLLQFSQIEAADPVLSEVNLRELVSEILKDRSFSINEHHAVVTVDIPFMMVSTWKIGFIEVVSNLLDNAIKFSKKAKPPRISIRAEDFTSTWRLVVADNGIGFDMKNSDRLYTLFSRLVTAEEFEGTGAGLAIVKRVLDKLNGTIRAESRPDQGATFIVDVPKMLITSPIVAVSLPENTRKSL